MRFLKYAGISIIFFVATCIFQTHAFENEVTIFEFDSLYHHIRVVEENRTRAIRFDNNHYQSRMNLNNPLEGHFDYINLLFQSFLFKPDPENILMLGLGGGSAQKLLHHYQPGIDILTVEIDPAIVDVARDYFFYDSDELPVVTEDARRFLRSSNDQWDIIFQDTYSSNLYGTYVPFHLATYEYFSLLSDRLSDDGILAINVIGTVYGGEPNRVITAIYRTLHEVFPQLYLFGANDAQNVLIIASKNENRLQNVEMRVRAQELINANRSGFPRNFYNAAFSQYYDTAPSGLSDARILTDDYAPTDNLLR